MHPIPLLLTLAAAPQATAPPTPETAIEDYLGHDSYAVAPLDLRADLPAQWTLSLPLAGRVETVALEKRSLRGPEFQLLVDDGRGAPLPVEAPPVSTYRGTIAGWPGAVVALTLTPSGAKGLVWDQGSAWTVEPLADVVPGAVAGAHLIAPVLTSPFDEGACGVAHGGAAGHGDAGTAASGGSPTCLFVADLSYDCDYECYLQFGSSVPATLADVEAVTNGMTVPYEEQIFTTYLLGTVLVRTAEPDPYTTTDSGALLNEFRDEWNTTQAGVTRDVVHLATGKELDSNIIGLAYVGTLCPNGFEYGLTQWNISFGSRISVVAHELGHNWSAPHCLDSTYCGIMCGGCLLSFGPLTEAKILGFRDTRGCLDKPAPVVADVFPNDWVRALVPGIQETVLVVGDCFTPDSSIAVDGTSLDDLPQTYTVQNSSAISFDMPQVGVLGPVELRVDDPRGSDATTIEVRPVTSPVHQVGDGEPANLLYNDTDAPFVLAGTPGDLHLLVYSQSDLPSVAPQVSLLIGNQFTELFLGGVYTIEPKGWTDFIVPLDGLLFATFYSQTVRITGGAPYEASNLQEVIVVF